jgi:ribosome-dependent ATPase
MTKEIIAHVSNVTHRYGASIALHDVTIDIPARVMVGVIGPDGVGKSTLLALIAGVRTIQSGHVVVFDGNIADTAYLKALRSRVAYMPQGLGRNLYPTLSVFENIDFFGRLFGQSASMIRICLFSMNRRRASTRFRADSSGTSSTRSGRGARK